MDNWQPYPKPSEESHRLMRAYHAALRAHDVDTVARMEAEDEARQDAIRNRLEGRSSP